MTRPIASLGLFLTVLSACSLLYGQAAQSQTDRVPLDPAQIGYLNLRQRVPGGLAGPEDFRRHTSVEALQSLDRIRRYLNGFDELAHLARTRFTAAEMDAIAKASDGISELAFQNVPLYIEGTLLKQDYQLRQAQYELAQLKRARGEIPSQELDRARAAYADATRRFQIFWDTKAPGD